ncbi:hypothetical protein FF38_04175 [Lucilia cuprina]|uniref:C-type lectin domain-containing protein n=1 Tax=Lucilia cuprina TaxID=7375 RepID=A0A0L0BTA9_LUCCU|nr:hypothetical protein FF38_04175 [Lucilia cuprina]
MWTYNFKIYLFLSFTSTALAGRENSVSSCVLDGYEDDFKLEPFTKVGKHFYYFGQAKVTWYKAFLICRSLGGFLASLESQEELNAISNYLIANYPLDRWWWLSGSDVDSEGNFYCYNTGERMKFFDWSEGQPDNYGEEHCVHLWFIKTKYQMNDWWCTRAAYYICKATKPKTIVLSVY